MAASLAFSLGIRLMLCCSFASAAAAKTKIYVHFPPEDLPASPTSSASSISAAASDAVQYQHLAVDPSTGTVYVGATNWLYQLDGADLRLVQSARIGPRPDNVRCTESFGENPCGGGGGRGSPATFPASATDNVNKVLVVDAANRQLVTCGSLFQGVCQARALRNVSWSREPETRGNTDYFTAANTARHSTVAFVAAGPGGADVLYVATTYTGTTPIRQTVPAISARSLAAGANLFRFAHTDGLTAGGSLVRFRGEAVERYVVVYVAGFAAGGFAYFLTNQRETFALAGTGLPPTVSGRTVSRIVQICQRDRYFYSYAEMPLRCRTSPGGVDYQLVRSAVLVRPGPELAHRLRMGAEERVLVATFSRGGAESEDSGGGGGDSSRESAVCVYRLADVRARFTQNIQKCFAAGVGQKHHVGHQFSNRICVPLVSVGTRPDESKDQMGRTAG